MIKLFAALRNILSLARLLQAVVMAAATVSVWYAAERMATGGEQRFILVALGFAAIGYLVVGSGRACRAWFERRIGEFAVCALVLVTAISWEAKMHLSTASLNEAGLTNVQKAKHNTLVSNADEFKRATETFNTAQFARDSLSREFLAPLPTIAGKPVATGAEARAIADNMRADKRRWDATNGCKEAVNKAQREFCGKYTEALTALKASDAKAGIEARLNEANKIFNQAAADLKAARAASDGSEVVTSGDRADTRNMIKLAAFLGFSSYDAEFSNALQMIIVISIILMVSEWTLVADEYKGKPRKPWGAIDAVRRAYSFLYYLVTGDRPKHTTVIREDTALRASMRAALNGKQVAA